MESGDCALKLELFQLPRKLPTKQAQLFSAVAPRHRLAYTHCVDSETTHSLRWASAGEDLGVATPDCLIGALFLASKLLFCHSWNPSCGGAPVRAPARPVPPDPNRLEQRGSNQTILPTSKLSIPWCAPSTAVHGMVLHPPRPSSSRLRAGLCGSSYVYFNSPLLSGDLLTLASQFLLGLITIAPWAVLIIIDAAIYLFRLVLWELPYIGGRTRGQQRPRAPSLNERPDGQRRAFSLRGVETDPSDDSRGIASGTGGRQGKRMRLQWGTRGCIPVRRN
ncbi:hypothetical protein N7470_002515 [Penicillium chermesinum]|nr:hypothetical protein N7470_002515 [Penicillium chermesinum]